MPTPVLCVIAGANGAGKTTFYEEILGPVTHLEFINADRIAAQLSPGDEPAMAYEAAALASQEREDRIHNEVSFITETVFSHPSKVELLQKAKAAGYYIELHIILIPEDLAVRRVASRVRNGGHDVPEEKIRARYRRLWSHVADAIGLAQVTKAYQNTHPKTPFELIAVYQAGILAGTARWPVWTPLALRPAG